MNRVMSRARVLMVLVLVLALVLFVGFRPVSGRYFGDMGSYSNWYNHIEGDIFRFDKNTENIGKNILYTTGL